LTFSAATNDDDIDDYSLYLGKVVSDGVFSKVGARITLSKLEASVTLDCSCTLVCFYYHNLILTTIPCLAFSISGGTHFLVYSSRGVGDNRLENLVPATFSIYDYHAPLDQFSDLSFIDTRTTRDTIAGNKIFYDTFFLFCCFLFHNYCLVIIRYIYI
jgi:hypothetical protein